jgi:hypothetical protein
MPQSQPAIAGLGITEEGQVYGRTAPQFAAEAVRLAVADAGLTLADLDEDLFGRRVQVAFEKVGDGETILYFTVIEEMSQ